MSLSLQQSQSYLYYFCREGFWRTLIHFSNESFDRYGDPFFIFWRAFAIFKEGNPSQAVNELTKIENKRELEWATAKASIYYHRKCKTVDERTVSAIERMEIDFARNATEKSVVAAAFFSMFIGEIDDAISILDGARFDSPITLVAKGWLQIKMKDRGDSVYLCNLYIGVGPEIFR